MALAEGVHELRKGGGALDLEENLVVVVRNLDVQMLALGLFVGIATGTRGLITVRHGVYSISNDCVVVDSDVGVVGAEEICESGVRGFSCHQALICVCLVSENGSTAFFKEDLPNRSARSGQSRATGRRSSERFWKIGRERVIYGGR